MKLIVAITGASGTIIGLRLVEELANAGVETHTIVSKSAITVAKHELDNHSELLSHVQSLSTHFHDEKDIHASIASGSYRTDGMIIAPCSMKTLSSVANGYSDNLIARAADVCIRYNRKLVIVPRETPLSAIHLENMLKLSRLGVTVLPPNLSYYNTPETVSDMTDFIVGKILDSFEIENNLYRRWKND